MKKADKIEALEILREELVNTDLKGICIVIRRMYDYDQLSHDQANFLDELIHDEKKKRSYAYSSEGVKIKYKDAMGFFTGYYWKIGNMKPRIKWVNRQIEILQDES